MINAYSTLTAMDNLLQLEDAPNQGNPQLYIVDVITNMLVIYDQLDTQQERLLRYFNNLLNNPLPKRQLKAIARLAKINSIVQRFLLGYNTIITANRIDTGYLINHDSKTILVSEHLTFSQLEHLLQKEKATKLHNATDDFKPTAPNSPRVFGTAPFIPERTF